MDIQSTKLELIKKLLDTTEEAVLADVWKVLEENRNVDLSLSETEYQVMDKRRERHIKGKSPSFSWEEVKQQARRMAAK